MIWVHLIKGCKLGLLVIPQTYLIVCLSLHTQLHNILIFSLFSCGFCLWLPPKGGEILEKGVMLTGGEIPFAEIYVLEECLYIRGVKTYMIKSMNLFDKHV